jgi:NAD(P)-dependent dehydrogenase (short-subunit alcohol dehydrogenase family)
MSPRIVLITGATAGIGRQTALQLAAKGFSIQLTGRDKVKCQAVLQEVENIFPGGGHQYFVSNFSDLGDVRMMANVISQNLDHIDVLIHNAGASFIKRELTPEGYEMTLTTNHLAPFLLTKRLLPLILKGDKPRIVNVASDNHFMSKMNIKDLHFSKRYFVMNAYSNSKLANVLFSNELAKRLASCGVVSNALHPGFVRTQIGTKNASWLSALFWKVFSAIGGISEEEGAHTSVYLASSPEVEGVSGKYFDNSQEKKPSRLALNEELGKQLWAASEEMIGEKWEM